MADLALSIDERSAVLSPCGRWRYLITRRWAEGGTTVVWVMLNPSLADSSKDDPTMKRVSQFSRAWGHNACAVVNLFAFRSPYPRDLATASIDIVGADNDRHTRDAIKAADAVVCGWGAFHHRRIDALIDDRATFITALCRTWKRDAMCLGTSNSGRPLHPLYLERSRPLVHYLGARHG